MDPLSITASIIALIQAAVGIAKGVEFIRSLGQIPAEFCDLLNELSTLQAIAAQVETALKGYENQQFTNGSPIILPNLDTSILAYLQSDLTQITTDLEALCNGLKKPGKAKSTGQEQVSKRKWHKERSNITRLREKVRATRQYLNLCFAAFTSSQASQQVRIALNIQEVVYSSAQDISQLMIQSGLMQEQNKKILESLQGLDNKEHNRTSDKNESRTKLITQTAATPMVSFQATSIHSCLHVCNCACHKLRHSQSPGWLASTVGSLCLQYNAIPFFHRVDCDVLSCQTRSQPSLRLYYAFPQWLIGRSIDCAVSWSSLTGAGSSLHLRVPRVNTDFGYVPFAFEYGDMRYIQSLIAKRRIFTTDVNERGQTLVQQAVQSLAFEIALFLMQQGFDIKSKDADGRTAIIEARRMYLAPHGSILTTKHMQSLQRFLEEISLQQNEHQPIIASEIHRAIVQEVDDSLDAIVTRNLSDLNTIDSFGYAPLHWAARKGNLKATQILLGASAIPDIPTIEGETALVLAVKFRHVRIARLLLDHSADANISRPGVHPPITYAFGHPEMIRLLLKYDARVNYEIGNGLHTPLQYAARSNFEGRVEYKGRTSWAESLDCLISAGADINDQSHETRRAPVMLALRNRNVLLVDLLIDAGARLDLVDVNGRGLLHIAARSTDIQSIEVLRHARISGIDPDKPDDLGLTPLMYLYRRLFTPDFDIQRPGRHRITSDEFWAFELFIKEIRMRNQGNRRLSYMELDSNKSDDESKTEWETVSVNSFPVDLDSERAEWGGSQNLRWESDEGSLIYTSSDYSGFSVSGSGSECESSDYEEFFDAEE